VHEYGSAAAFRAAVEAKLRERARQLGVPAYVLRRQAGLERLMARLTALAPGRWALKGGFALETRLGRRARVSLDLDADHLTLAALRQERIEALQEADAIKTRAVATAVAGLKEIVDYAIWRLAALLLILPRRGYGDRLGLPPPDRGTSPPLMFLLRTRFTSFRTESRCEIQGTRPSHLPDWA